MTSTRLTIDILKNGIDALNRQWAERRKQTNFEVQIVVPSSEYDAALCSGILHDTGYMDILLEGYKVKVIRGERLPE